MNLLKAGHLVVGAALIVVAVLSGAWVLVGAGIALAALGWLGLCPMYRVIARLDS
jgi:hypothetical protein